MSHVVPVLLYVCMFVYMCAVTHHTRLRVVYPLTSVFSPLSVDDVFFVSWYQNEPAVIVDDTVRCS